MVFHQQTILSPTGRQNRFPEATTVCLKQRCRGQSAAPSARDLSAAITRCLLENPVESHLRRRRRSRPHEEIPARVLQLLQKGSLRERKARNWLNAGRGIIAVGNKDEA